MRQLSILEEIIDLHKVWPHEALDFTLWFVEEENMAILANVVGLDITVDEQEYSVGNTAEEIENFGDDMNDLPRRQLKYRTSSKLLESFLDEVYAAPLHILCRVSNLELQFTKGDLI